MTAYAVCEHDCVIPSAVFLSTHVVADSAPLSYHDSPNDLRCTPGTMRCFDVDSKMPSVSGEHPPSQMLFFSLPLYFSCFILPFSLSFVCWNSVIVIFRLLCFGWRLIFAFCSGFSSSGGPRKQHRPGVRLKCLGLHCLALSVAFSAFPYTPGYEFKCTSWLIRAIKFSIAFDDGVW